MTMKHLFLIVFVLLTVPAFANDSAKSIIIADIALKKKPNIPKTQTAAPKEKPAAENATTQNYIGKMDRMRASFEDTLLELGREHNLGYVEMIAANPGVDPWLPGRGTRIILPKRHLIPHGIERTGLIINLAEMRLYDFVTDPANPKTHPLGVGRNGLNTPTGLTKIMRKKEGPSWRPTPRMRKADPELPAVVEPGPDNPLGTHALYLGWPQYLIHGTHKPLGVGRRVSSGCIRMYPEDIIRIFDDIPLNTRVNVIKQPIKLAWIGSMLYLEAHAEGELADTFEESGKIKEYRVPETLFSDLSNIAGDHKDRLDWGAIREAVKYRQGIPVKILTYRKNSNDMEINEDILDIDDKPIIEKKPKTLQSFQLNG